MPKPTQDEMRAQLLQEPKVTLAAMEALGQLKTTREIKFAPGSQFPPRGFQELVALPRLQFLSFTQSVLTADDLIDIARLPLLRHLFLNDCPGIGDREIMAFSGERPSRLEHFWLANTGITDLALAAMGDNLPAVQWIDLRGTAITDAGVQHLAAIPGLATLYLDHTAVTDDGLLALAVLPRLKIITYKGTAITLAGIDALFRAQIAHKRRASQSTTDPDDATMAATKEILLAFMAAMNTWESDAYRDLSSAEGFSAEFLARHQPILQTIFERYCTKRSRVYGYPNVQSVGVPPTYDPATTELVEYEQPEKRRVILYTKEHGSRRYQYVFQFANDEWRLDHRKSQGGSGWQQAPL